MTHFSSHNSPQQKRGETRPRVLGGGAGRAHHGGVHLSGPKSIFHGYARGPRVSACSSMKTRAKNARRSFLKV